VRKCCFFIGEGSVCCITITGEHSIDLSRLVVVFSGWRYSWRSEMGDCPCDSCIVSGLTIVGTTGTFFLFVSDDFSSTFCFRC
jgi:hypothetical protein